MSKDCKDTLQTLKTVTTRVRRKVRTEYLSDAIVGRATLSGKVIAKVRHHAFLKHSVCEPLPKRRHETAIGWESNT